MDRVERILRAGALTAAIVAGVAASSPTASAAPQAVPNDDMPFAPVAVPNRPAGVRGQFGRARLAVPVAEEIPWTALRLAAVTPEPRVEALVADLGSSDFAARDAATKALRDPAIADEQVWLQLSRANGRLGNEAHARLLEVGRSRIIDAPRGALGIQMAGRLGDGEGVTVTGLIPNMPARKVLRAGDRIVEIDGKPTMISEQLSAIVQMHKPGDRVSVVVMRGERDELGRVKGGPDGRPVETRLELELEVGSRADLDRFGGGGRDTMLSDDGRVRLAERLMQDFAVQPRVLRVRRSDEDPIDVDLHPEILALREQLDRPDGLGSHPSVGAVLRARLATLRATARAPGLSDDERAWFEAVAARYLELIPAELRPDEPGAESR